MNLARFLLLVLLGAIPAWAAEPLNVPEKFFRGDVQPNGVVRFVYIKPNEPSDTGWNAFAKFMILVETDPEFRAAYMAVSNDPELQATGITFAAWSGGTQEEKAAVRARMHAAVQRIVEKHRLRKLLVDKKIDDALIIAKRTTLLAGTESETPSPLIRFCPGAVGNVSVNPQHPSFKQFQRMLDDPKATEQYKAALKSFSDYLERNPTSSVDDKNAEISRLLSQVLATVP